MLRFEPFPMNYTNELIFWPFSASRVFLFFTIFFSCEIDNNNFSFVGECLCVCAVAAVQRDYTRMCTKNEMALVGALGCAQSTLPADSTYYIIFMPHFFHPLIKARSGQ